MSSERWKWRMLVAAAEFESSVATDDDILIVDGMLDVSTLVALLRSRNNNSGTHHHHQCPKIYVYMHENQLTTPFTQQDRDRQKQTHWHYGLVHWRSLQVADGLIFNSRQHLTVFTEMLPKLIRQQCPRDTVQWHLDRVHELLQTKCTVLRYGLELEQLVQFQTPPPPSSLSQLPSAAAASPQTKKQKLTDDPKKSETETPPIILWNARLEEDKDPKAFFQLLCYLRKQGVPFRLIVLGTDPSKGQVWYEKFRTAFGNQELLHIGFCTDRSEYSYWLHQANVTISTAQHETFGASIVESVFCGALPLLPNRLSYPELFPVDQFPNHFYETHNDCFDKLIALFQLSNEERTIVSEKTKAAVAQYQWSIMGTVYDNFFELLASGQDLVMAGQIAEREASKLTSIHKTIITQDGITINDSAAKTSTNKTHDVAVIADAADPRVALYRPKSLRDHQEYHKQLSSYKSQGLEPSMHGGRRAMVRMLEAISTGSPIRPLSFLTTPELATQIFVHSNNGSAKQQNSLAQVYVAEKELLDTIRGQKLNAGDAVLAMIQFPVVSQLQDLIHDPPILVLADVRNSENVGSILRTAFCLGITSVVASNTAWAALKDSRAARCSMGTIYYHKFYKADNIATTLQDIHNGGVRVYGVEIGPESSPVKPHGQDHKWAAVMGNEDVGMSAEVRNACDCIVFVPQAHGNSLNVGHAAAITMFELGRETPVPQHDGSATCT